MYLISKQLITGLNEAQIKYCHWKSNLFLNKALAGYDDLDLLVHHSDFQGFVQLVSQLGFKEVISPGIAFPYIHHFYGLDSETGNLLHLHIYTKIVTGSSLSKSHMLPPIDEAIFSHLVAHTSTTMIPSPAMELLIFTIRSLLKLSSPSDIVFNYVDLKSIREEYSFLLSLQNGTEEFKSLGETLFPLIPKSVWDASLEEFRTGGTFSLFCLGLKLRSGIKHLRRVSLTHEAYIIFTQCFIRLYRKVFKIKKSPIKGGSLLVISGLDATGKSTTVDYIYKNLKKVFTCKKIHLGTPPSAWRTKPFNLLLNFYKKNTKKNNSSKSVNTSNKQSITMCIRYWILSIDRKVEAQKYLRQASKGYLIISDRYPSKTIGVMDSPRLLPELYSGVRLFVAKLEVKNYQKIAHASYLIELYTDIDTAIKRNHERIKDNKETEKELIARHHDNQNLDHKAIVIEKFDTSGDKDKNLKAIYKCVWNNL